MGLYIEGEGPQARRQQGQELLGGGQRAGQGQMEQDGGGRRHKSGRCLQLGIVLPLGREQHLHLIEGKPGVLDLVEGEVGVGVDQAGGQPRSCVRTGEIFPRGPRRFLRLAHKIVVFRPGDVPLGPLLHGLYRGQAVPRLEGGIHEGHQVRIIRRCRDLGLSFPFSGKAGVLGFLRVRRDGPGPSKLLRAGDAAGDAELLHHPGRDVPFFRGLPHSEIFHGTTLQRWCSDSYYMHAGAWTQGGRVQRAARISQRRTSPAPGLAPGRWGGPSPGIQSPAPYFRGSGSAI